MADTHALGVWLPACKKIHFKAVYARAEHTQAVLAQRLHDGRLRTSHHVVVHLGKDVLDVLEPPGLGREGLHLAALDVHLDEVEGGEAQRL